MGIVNLTADSFYPASRQTDPEAAVAVALAQIEAGADLLDLGAESSRPGATPVGPDIEQQRLLPVVEALRDRTEVPISVDTTNAATARAVLAAGADAVNDVSAGTADPDLISVVADAGCGLVLMHMRGSPATMQDDPRYDDVVATVGEFLADRCHAVIRAGVAADRLVVDPGIGFGKTLPHNLKLLAALERIGGEYPVLLGASRKRFIDHLCDVPVEQRLPGSLAALVSAYRAGVAVVRVHDVAESKQFLDVLAAIDDVGSTRG